MSQAVLKKEIAYANPAVIPTEPPRKPRLSPVPDASPGTAPPRRARALAVTLVLGLVSAALYLLLFEYGDGLAVLAAETRHGHKLYALVPIAIAFLFSAVHGAFTGYFWDLLGLKAKGK